MIQCFSDACSKLPVWWIIKHFQPSTSPAAAASFVRGKCPYSEELMEALRGHPLQSPGRPIDGALSIQTALRVKLLTWKAPFRMYLRYKSTIFTFIFWVFRSCLLQTDLFLCFLRWRFCSGWIHLDRTTGCTATLKHPIISMRLMINKVFSRSIFLRSFMESRANFFRSPDFLYLKWSIINPMRISCLETILSLSKIILIWLVFLPSCLRLEAHLVILVRFQRCFSSDNHLNTNLWQLFEKWVFEVESKNQMLTDSM